MASYDIAENWDSLDAGQKARVINLAAVGQIEKWASDPACNQRAFCAAAINKMEEVADPPFAARTEISADARYVAGRIVKHLWIIFVALPFVLATLYAILTAK